MHNPLRSEAEAFRFVLIVGGGAAAVIALTLLTRPVFGVVLAAALIGMGAGLAWRGARGSVPHKAEVARDGTGRKRHILVVANQTVAGRALLAEIRNRCKGTEAEVLVVSPVLTGSKLKHWVSDTDGAYEDAKVRLADSVAAIRSAGLSARGDVGDSDPHVAIEDALLAFPADEVIISTHPPGRSNWLERGVVEQAREEVDLPVTHVVVDLEREAAGQG